jgi:hypothetical protein
MKFARAISNGVGLHCPDLTAGAPVYTPDELGVEDPDADIAPVDEPNQDPAAETAKTTSNGREDADVVAERLRELTEAAEECNVAAETVVELSRLYYDQGDLESLTAVQAAEMADRLRYAARVGLDDAKLARLAARGLSTEDRVQSARAADVWLTARRQAM